MKDSIYLSETKQGFEPQRSLSEQPITFENSQVNGCVFYFPVGDELGGDSFIITADNYVTISLLGDMTGHGKPAREKLTPFVEYLKRLTIPTYDQSGIQKLLSEITELDKKLDLDQLLALSFTQVFPDGNTYYINEGENRLLVYKDGEVIDLTEKISHGKIGLLDLTVGDEETIKQKIAPYCHKLKQGDKVLICSDGVEGYLPEMPNHDQRMAQIQELLASSLDVVEILKSINNYALKEMENRDVKVPVDDYTAILFEIKKGKQKILYTSKTIRI